MIIEKKPIFKEIAGERVLIMQGKTAQDMTKIITMNATSEYLMNNLIGKDFSVSDISKLLCDKYDVEKSIADNDAEEWAKQMIECGIIKK